MRPIEADATTMISQADQRSIGDHGVRPVIGILTWRGYEQTRNCLQSLVRLSDWPVPTVVVDNGSGTGEAERLAREFGDPVSALTLADNGGVPAGYNAIMSWARKRGASHVLLLNNDTLIRDPDLLDQLIGASGPDVAAAGPVIREGDGSVWAVGCWVDWIRGRARQHKAPPTDGKVPVDVEWLDGCCLFVSLDAAVSVGGFASEFFMYWEDVDWCVRAGRAGFRCVVHPAVEIVHLRGGSQPGLLARQYILRNALLFVRRNGSASENVSSLAYFLLIRTPGEVLRSAWPPARLVATCGALAYAVWWNIHDAVGARRWRRAATGPSVE